MEPPNKDLIATSNGAKVHRPYLLQSVMYVTQAAIVNCNYHFYTTGPSALYVFGENRTARGKNPDNNHYHNNQQNKNRQSLD
jgi:hypothetical protein